MTHREGIRRLQHIFRASERNYAKNDAKEVDGKIKNLSR